MALLTVSEVAKILKVNKQWVYDAHKSGILKFMKLGHLKCRQEELEKFLKAYEGKDITNPYEVKEL